MKRTSLALVLSLVLHMSVIAAVYLWMYEKPTSQSERKVIHMRALTLSKEAPKTVQSVPNEIAMQTPHQVSSETKPPQTPPKKKDTTPSKVSKPLSPPPTPVVSEENNVSAALEHHEPTPSPVHTPIASAPSSSTPMYLELHGDEIRQAIEKEKEYPMLARRRSITGIVEMSFTLTPNGAIEGIQASSPSKILSASALETVHKAKVFFPLPKENVTIKIPISYVMK